ncbi:uncharacterized protein LOC122516605 [Polistes fuscatus]|uniref:uncharacterized protein LOC122516605 n=1 Tax=Polistes fuscatus TaxID=30207 RepID=UPI001CAA1E2D|nr:uncharacterized protein LOC122516605 [Polistes fuscatus]
MDPVKLRFYAERYEKENRILKLQEQFVLTTHTKSLTGKFYARHDAVSSFDIPEEYIEFIERRTALTPKNIYTFRPPSVNMEYGWFTKLLIPISNDPRLNFVKKGCDFIKKELYQRHLQKGLPVKRFTGVPFKT